MFNERQVAVYPLGKEDEWYISQFDCEDEEMNRFFREECLEEQNFGLNKTFVLYYCGDLAAFCSICADRISLASSEKEVSQLPRNSVPAVKIARLGRDKKYKDLKLGRYLMEYVQYQVLNISQEQLGIRFITLDAYPARVPFYESLNFIQNVQQDARKGTVSMRFDIFSSSESLNMVNEDTA
ncbi:MULTISPECIES: GNAT family N-acetyltransferase [unclassified Paenibacillus]|uniref:GNAT family N-acetyltransferase n=1 Tax=unclassified Paenibacillus TaxID=185978 RepID=UPI00020D7002|nr:MULTISPECIES: GNAT family N-acetyltransferase [unclassified Paenibacillus]EGL20013.1 hypothetical protein HMPREF9413_1076 [Paenibacillus sp. HGF7]EPD82029.1 hypothetical protein HMPREF1207_03855 [Paenibacillus sp. HGH0039]